MRTASRTTPRTTSTHPQGSKSAKLVKRTKLALSYKLQMFEENKTDFFFISLFYFFRLCRLRMPWVDSYNISRMACAVKSEPSRGISLNSDSDPLPP